MSLTNSIEWTMEGCWVTVLQAASDLVSAVGAAARIRRAYDLTAGTADTLPAVTVAVVGVQPQLAYGNGYYIATVRIIALTSMDDDTTGQTRANLCAAIRDVFEASGLEAALQAASAGTMLVGSNAVQQPEGTQYDDLPADAKPVRRAWFEYQCRVTMKPTLVTPP